MAQSGCFYRAFNAWHLRYYETRAGVRVQRSRRICDGNKSKAEARLIAAPFIEQINADDNAPTAVEPDQTIADFWVSTYDPYIAKHKRANTVHSYRVIWSRHLKAHFGDRELRSYRTPEATKFLSKLAEKRGQRTVQHVRSLMSGIYSHAVAIGACKSNPIADAKILGDLIAPGETAHYTLEEAEDIISALADRVDAQLIFALAYFAGLRPGEINALKWEDLDTEFVHIRRAIGRGVVAEPKTKKSIRSIPLIAPVRIPLELWRRKCGNRTEGWVFESSGTLPEERIDAPEFKRFVGGPSPIDLHNVIRRVIVPHIEGERACVLCDRVPKPAGVWKTMYSGRRGDITITIEKTGGNYAVAQALAGHKHMTTTLNVYKKAITPEAFEAGMRQLETSLKESQ